MKHAKQGDWVQITNVVMTTGNRAPQVPRDTQECDLKMWVKGFAQHDADEGDEVEIVTATGRCTRGTLSNVNPAYTHTYGDFVPELVEIQRQLRELVFGEV